MGPRPQRRRRPGRAQCGRGRSGGGVRLQIPERRARRAGVPVRRRALARAGPAADHRLVRSRRAVRFRHRVPARARHRALSGRHAADPQPESARGRGRHAAAGGPAGTAAEGDRPHGCVHPAGRRAVRRVWLWHCQPASRRRARRAGGAEPCRRLSHRAGADRARRDRRFSGAGPAAVRLRPALRPLRRRMGCSRRAPCRHDRGHVGSAGVQTAGRSDMSDDTDPALEPGVKTDFGGQLTYGRYLALDQLLDCQRPVSESHDELLFIVIHQATELWLKLMVHELRGARRRVIADDLQPAFKMLARVSRIQAQLIQSWDVLSTLTPADYLAFRDRLGPASGLQSHQYRLLECLLGHKRPEGLAIPADHLERDWRQPYRAAAAVRAAWAQVYRDPSAYWDLYELAEELIDLEDWSRQWRFFPPPTGERVIRRQTGTRGRSAGDDL